MTPHNFLNLSYFMFSMLIFPLGLTLAFTAALYKFTQSAGTLSCQSHSSVITLIAIIMTHHYVIVIVIIMLLISSSSLSLSITIILGLPFLAMYSWTGIWTSLFMALSAVFNLSSYIRYCTRFTDDCFNALLATNFLYEAGRYVNLYCW